MDSAEKQPFMAHLEELRKRLIVCAIVIMVGFVAAYLFKERLFQVLIAPLREELPEGVKLTFLGPTEMFFTYLKVALIAGILASAPIIFYQIWMFVAPGLYQNEKRYMLPFVVSSTFLFIGGALFGYFIVFPFGFKFFLGFANEAIEVVPRVGEYFSFTIKLLLAFGLVFELPVVIFFLSKMGVVTPEFLKKKRKYALLLTFAVAAVFTPPDVVTQTMLAGPLIVLYEAGIIVAQIARSRKQREEEGDGEE